MNTGRGVLTAVDRALEDRWALYGDIRTDGFEGKGGTQLRFSVFGNRKMCNAVCTLSENQTICSVAYRTMEEPTRLQWSAADVEQFLKTLNTAASDVLPGGEFVFEAREVRYKIVIENLVQAPVSEIIKRFIAGAQDMNQLLSVLEDMSKRDQPLDDALVQKLVEIYGSPD